MIVLAAYLFYNSLWSCIFLSPVIPIYVVLRKKEAYGKKISRKTMEFSDGMQPMIFTSRIQPMIFTSHLTFIYHSYTLITDIRVKTSFGAYIINIRRDIYA